jgi:hypothetical protein
MRVLDLPWKGSAEIGTEREHQQTPRLQAQLEAGDGPPDQQSQGLLYLSGELSRLAKAHCLDPMICPACKSESLMIWTMLAPKVEFDKSFWHKRLPCKSYQRLS